MPDYAVQSVLGVEKFVRTRELNVGGKVKDFYAGRNPAFKDHRDGLAKQLMGLKRQLENETSGDGAYAKIALVRSALAKSHRPVKSLFNARRTPVVGNGDVGDLIVEVHARALADVATTILGAELDPPLKKNEKTGQMERKPSRARGEVGAIASINLWGPSDRRSFSATEAIEWLGDRTTGSGYLVQLFRHPMECIPGPNTTWSAVRLMRSFEGMLTGIGTGIRAELLSSVNHALPVIFVRMELGDAPPSLHLYEAKRERDSYRAIPDLRIEQHVRLLAALETHPLVRAIELPPKIRSSFVGASNATAKFSLPKRGDGPYPRVGIVDGGIADCLNPWVIGNTGILADEDRSEAHGTFIGGLLAAGSSANAHCNLEPDGCELVDVGIHPSEASFQNYYPKGVTDFFDELEAAVERSKDEHNVRFFNLSLNLTQAAEPSHYHYFAARLDAIADKYDVVFVISAGNLDATVRPEWTNNEVQNLTALANSRQDGILTPAESVRNLSVAALNPPNHPSCIGLAPTAYTRRGPGLRTGVKPDFAHIGGSLTRDIHAGHGLNSLAPNGNQETGCGTSYAAPFVARTLAQLDAAIEGKTSRETLIALLAHSASTPEAISSKRMRPVARDLVGFGIPACAESILAANDSEITLVFEARIMPNTELVFPFSWPSSLVANNGGCRGKVRVTIASTPPLDFRYGSELVRVNLDAALQQDTGTGWKGHLHPAFLPNDAGAHFEKELIEHALKWAPVKTYHTVFPKGVGSSSNWRIHVEYLLRSQEEMPPEGVPFTLIFTLSDVDGKANRKIYQEVSQAIGAIGVATADIRTAARVRQRTGT